MKKKKNFDYQLTKGKKKGSARASESSKTPTKGGLEPNSHTEPHRSESTALSSQPNPHLRASSKIVQFEFVLTVVKSTMPSYEKLQCRLTAPFIIVACDGDLQRKK